MTQLEAKITEQQGLINQKNKKIDELQEKLQNMIEAEAAQLTSLTSTHSGDSSSVT